MTLLDQWAKYQIFGWFIEIVYIMLLQQLLREENYHLKNQISQLKNAFNLNRSILQIITREDMNKDKQHKLLIQVINKLTTMSNQAVMSNIQLIQEKNTLKSEIYRLNNALNTIQEQLQRELENGKLAHRPTQARLLLHEQFTNLNRELLAFNEEKLAFSHEIQFWKHNCLNNSTQQTFYDESFANTSRNSRIKRKYTSNENLKAQWTIQQLKRQNIKLKQNIEQLEGRLIILIKAHGLEEKLKRESKQKNKIWNDKQEIMMKLCKFALSDITIEQRNDDMFLIVTRRFQDTQMPKNKSGRSSSCPKYKAQNPEDFEEEQQIYE